MKALTEMKKVSEMSSEEIKEAGNHKEIWYNKMRDKGLRVKLALDDSGEVGGMIQYIPIEHSFVEGDALYFINCIWVTVINGEGETSKKEDWGRLCSRPLRMM